MSKEVEQLFCNHSGPEAYLKLHQDFNTLSICADEVLLSSYEFYKKSAEVSEKFKLFAEAIRNCSLIELSAEERKKVELSHNEKGLRGLAQTVKEISIFQDTLTSQLKYQFVIPLKQLVKIEIAKVLESRSNMEQMKNIYESERERFCMETQRDSCDPIKYSKLEKKVAEAKRNYQENWFHYMQELINVSKRKQLDLTELLLTYVQSTRNHFEKGHKLMRSVDPQLDQLSESIKKQRKMLSKVASELDESLQKSYKEYESVNQFFPHSGLHKEGFLWLSKQKTLRKNWHRFWFIVDQGTIRYYKSWKDRQEIETLHLLLCTVKQSVEEPSCFELISPKRTVVLQASKEGEVLDWINVIQNNIMHQLNIYNKNASLYPKSPLYNEVNDVPSNAQNPRLSVSMNGLSPLQQVQMSHESNLSCADCGKKDPDWVVINLGIVICHTCSGVHRSLGVHISKVRSLKLDKIEPITLSFLKLVGNEKSNCIYESKMPPSAKLSPNSTRESRDKFIRDKYVQRIWVNVNPNLAPDDIFQMMFVSVSENRPEEIMDFIAQGVNINSTDEESGKGILHVLAERGQAVWIEALLQNGAQLQILDHKLWSPLHFAAAGDSTSTCRLLLNYGLDSSAIDIDGKTPLEIAAEHESLSVQPLLKDIVGDAPSGPDIKALKKVKSEKMSKILISSDKSDSVIHSPIPENISAPSLAQNINHGEHSVNFEKKLKNSNNSLRVKTTSSPHLKELTQPEILKREHTHQDNLSSSGSQEDASFHNSHYKNSFSPSASAPSPDIPRSRTSDFDDSKSPHKSFTNILKKTFRRERSQTELNNVMNSSEKIQPLPELDESESSLTGAKLVTSNLQYSPLSSPPELYVPSSQSIFSADYGNLEPKQPLPQRAPVQAAIPQLNLLNSRRVSEFDLESARSTRSLPNTPRINPDDSTQEQSDSSTTDQEEKKNTSQLMRMNSMPLSQFSEITNIPVVETTSPRMKRLGSLEEIVNTVSKKGKGPKSKQGQMISSSSPNSSSNSDQGSPLKRVFKNITPLNHDNRSILSRGSAKFLEAEGDYDDEEELHQGRVTAPGLPTSSSLPNNFAVIKKTLPNPSQILNLDNSPGSVGRNRSTTSPQNIVLPNQKRGSHIERKNQKSMIRNLLTKKQSSQTIQYRAIDSMGGVIITENNKTNQQQTDQNQVGFSSLRIPQKRNRISLRNSGDSRNEILPIAKSHSPDISSLKSSSEPQEIPLTTTTTTTTTSTTTAESQPPARHGDDEFLSFISSLPPKISNQMTSPNSYADESPDSKIKGVWRRTLRGFKPG